MMALGAKLRMSVAKLQGCLLGKTLEGDLGEYLGVNLGHYLLSPPVLIHMSMGFMILAMILSLVLLFAMGFSFRPALRRLNKTDLVFSTLSSFTGKCCPGKRLRGGVSQNFCPAGSL